MEKIELQKIKIILEKIKLNEPEIGDGDEEKAVLILYKDGIKVDKLKDDITADKGLNTIIT